jgi:predicted HicB family RNase H-like nuclease
MSHNFDGFTPVLFLDEQGDWVAHFEELPNISAFGPTTEKALYELGEAWAGMKECYEEDGELIPVAPSRKKYSGHFNVSVSKRIHMALDVEAAQSHISFNDLVAQKLTQAARVPLHL